MAGLKHRAHLPRLLLAGLVLALAYLGGALAPSLLDVTRAAPLRLPP